MAVMNRLVRAITPERYGDEEAGIDRRGTNNRRILIQSNEENDTGIHGGIWEI